MPRTWCTSASLTLAFLGVPCLCQVPVKVQVSPSAAIQAGDRANHTGNPLQALALKVIDLENELATVKQSMLTEAQQVLAGLMNAQWAAEEAVRQQGGSGITKTRSYQGGSKSYHAGSYTTSNMAAMHNHPDSRWTAGLGEFAAIINGVAFRTRHNDYSLKMASTTSHDYHATENVPLPPVPDSVKSLSTVDEQIVEMREYFQAYKHQDVTHRNYKPYFRPVLCYLEAGWEKFDGDTLVEPFESERHHIAAAGWKDLVEKVRFFDFSGGKDVLENLPWLPTSVMDIEIKDGQLAPHLVRWNYRILCHPIDGDVELARLHLVDDAMVKALRRPGGPHDAAYMSKEARFRVDPRLPLEEVIGAPDAEVRIGRNYLDLLMEQIPGKDNYGAALIDEALNPTTYRLEPHKEGDRLRATRGTALGSQHVKGPLNTAYYTRYFMAGQDAMGRGNYKRGFNDPTLFAAMTTHDKIANVSMINSGSKIRPGEICLTEDGHECPRVVQRWTYAIPLEIIYLTPLFNWNPYNITLQTTRDGVTGDGGEETPFTAAAEKDYFHMTPAHFYGDCAVSDVTELGSVDRTGGAVNVLDQAGVKRKVVTSGLRIATRCLPGVGRARLRFPIMPLHEDGSTAWKEIKALEKLIMTGMVPDLDVRDFPPDEPMAELTLGGGGDHEHQVILDENALKRLHEGDDVWVTASFNEGHTHDVMISSFIDTKDESAHDWVYQIDMCRTGGTPGPNGHTCRDGHKALILDFVNP